MSWPDQPRADHAATDRPILLNLPTGKTTILYKLKLGEIVTTIPTMSVSSDSWQLDLHFIKSRSPWCHSFRATQTRVERPSLAVCDAPQERLLQRAGQLRIVAIGTAVVGTFAATAQRLFALCETEGLRASHGVGWSDVSTLLVSPFTHRTGRSLRRPAHSPNTFTPQASTLRA